LSLSLTSPNQKVKFQVNVDRELIGNRNTVSREVLQCDTVPSGFHSSERPSLTSDCGWWEAWVEDCEGGRRRDPWGCPISSLQLSLVESVFSVVLASYRASTMVLATLSGVLVLVEWFQLLSYENPTLSLFSAQ
jgi:hypothetical protein